MQAVSLGIAAFSDIDFLHNSQHTKAECPSNLRERILVSWLQTTQAWNSGGPRVSPGGEQGKGGLRRRLGAKHGHDKAPKRYNDMYSDWSPSGTGVRGCYIRYNFKILSLTRCSLETEFRNARNKSN